MGPKNINLIFPFFEGKIKGVYQQKIGSYCQKIFFLLLEFWSHCVHRDAHADWPFFVCEACEFLHSGLSETYFSDLNCQVRSRSSYRSANLKYCSNFSECNMLKSAVIC